MCDVRPEVAAPIPPKMPAPTLRTVPPAPVALTPPRKRLRLEAPDSALASRGHARSAGRPRAAANGAGARSSSGARAGAAAAGGAAARNKHWVFVYGNMTRGSSNAGVLAGATFIGEFRTVCAYPLVVGGAYFSPYLLDVPGKGSTIKGEVYACSDALLASLDRFENVGAQFARRVIKVASCTDRSFDANVFGYFKTNYANDLLVQRYHSEHQSSARGAARTHRPASAVAAQARNDAGSSMYNGRLARAGRR